MNKFLKFIFIFWTFSFVHHLTGQENYMSMFEAISRGLEENLDLQVLESDVAIAQVNTGKGAAGMLPSVAASATSNYSVNNSSQTFLDGRENSVKGGQDFSLNGDVRMDWTIFDGRAMYLRRDLLDDQVVLSQLQLQETATTLAHDIARHYQNMILQKRALKVVDENIAYYEALLNLAEGKLEIGSGTKIDVLQSEIDLNQLINSRRQIELQYQNQNTALNNLLQLPHDYALEVDTQFLVIPEDPQFETLLNETLEQNKSLQILNHQERLAQYQIGLAESQKLPVINLNAGLNGAYAQSNTGFLTNRNSYGPYVGLSATYNIYDGKRVQREIKTAELEVERNRIVSKAYTTELATQLSSFIDNYQFYKNIIALEKKNLDLARTNNDLAAQMYRSGRISLFDLRQVNLEFLGISQRLIEAEFNLVDTFISIMELKGQNWM